MNNSEKKRKVPEKKWVQEMFNRISKQYDFLNHFLSLGTDIYWRRKLIRIISRQHHGKPGEQGLHILDVATGTGDQAIELMRLNPQMVHGTDISVGMLDLARIKVRKKGMQDRIEFQVEDAEAMTFQRNCFDVVTISFGIRNVERMRKGLEEMYRVLKPGGKLYILEFSHPRRFPVKQFYHFYLNHLVPWIGRIVAGDKGAYQYLSGSINQFIDGEEMVRELQSCHFQNIRMYLLTGGIASIYQGEKPDA